jgi:hypothetical protein
LPSDIMDAMRAVRRHREFRLLWMATSASTLGDRIVFVALALYVTDIGSPSDVGIVLRGASARRARRWSRRCARAGGSCARASGRGS